jgi:hypothetical protein
LIAVVWALGSGEASTETASARLPLPPRACGLIALKSVPERRKIMSAGSYGAEALYGRTVYSSDGERRRG